jgi:hypothetical protein
MVSDGKLQSQAQKKGLQLLNVLWEDTGRYLGSSVGPNISDVTIEVEFQDGQQQNKQTSLMPVLRFPNFTDKTGDIDIDKFLLRVGNQKQASQLASKSGQKNKKMKTVSLRQLLANPTKFMSLPNKGTIKGGSLLAERDDKVLVSAQSTFLPIRKGGSTRFWPVIFNYQSSQKSPAVLTILVTRQGTSMTIIDNQRDVVSGGWGQRLYFNAEGQRAPLTAERLKDVQNKGVTMNGEDAQSLGKDSNLLMLIQVPLKVKASGRGFLAGFEGAPMMAVADDEAEESPDAESDVDVAVLGHGPSMGPYTELDGLTIERDDRFPVRVTVQFYQATSNGVVSDKDLDRMAKQIDKVYKQADYVGSLVVPDDGEQRPTMWTGVTKQPPNLSWWDFAGLRERFLKLHAHPVEPKVTTTPLSDPMNLLLRSYLSTVGPVFGL